MALALALLFASLHSVAGWCSPADEGDCFIMIRAGGNSEAAMSAAHGIRFMHRAGPGPEETAFGHIAAVPNTGSEAAEMLFALGGSTHARISGNGTLAVSRLAVGDQGANGTVHAPFTLQVTGGGLRVVAAQSELPAQISLGEAIFESLGGALSVETPDTLRLHSSSAGRTEIQGATFLAGEAAGTGPSVQVGSLTADGGTLRVLASGPTPASQLVLETSGSEPGWTLEAKSGNKPEFAVAQGETRILRFAGGAPADAVVLTADGNIGLGTRWPVVKLDVNGGVQGTSAYSSASDRRWKRKIRDLADSLPGPTGILDQVGQLRPVTFEWRHSQFPDMRFDRGSQVGFIAQEVEQVVPEVVTSNANGMKAIKYAALTPLLAGAISQLRLEFERQTLALQQELAQLREHVRQLELASVT